MKLKSVKILTGILAGIIAVSLTGCGSQSPNAGPQVSLTGAGSSFIYPLMSQMIDTYRESNPNITINYQSVGSGAGIKQISEQTIDFGGTDAFMKDDQLASAKGGKILQIPLTLGAEAVVYNLPDNPKDLKISPEVLVDIFLGKITNWNDPKIAADNAGVNLPDLKITVAHRSDGSGTTAIFSDYLSNVSPEWKNEVGMGTSLNWKVGVGGKGNAGVAGIVQKTPGSIGYVELAYAVQNEMTYAQLKNKAGKWLSPSLEGASAAAAEADIPDDMRVSIVNAPGDAAYPIAGFSWGLIYQNQDKSPNNTVDKATALVNFMNWAIHDGQNLSESLQYAKLPANLVSREEAMLKTVTFNGQAILK